MHLEALVEQLRLTQVELGIELEYTYLKRKEAGEDGETNNVSLDHTSDFSLQHISAVEDCLKKAQAEKNRRENEVTELENDLAELIAELGHNASISELPMHRYTMTYIA